MNIGIFGGTFDPPHIGHLVIADQALSALGLDEVWFTPVGQPTHKAALQVSPAVQRVAMTRLAIATHPRFRVCERDVERPGPHYSLTLLQTLRAEFPQHAWTFIIGEDSLADLPNWHRPAELFALTVLAVARRPGSAPDLSAIRGVVPQIDNVRSARSVRYLIPRAAAEYAIEHGLFVSPAPHA
jgi:nicotinate-nucleotide adenylyltransferase